MNPVEKNYVKYYPVDGHFVVGDNSTTIADGITDTSYSGEIVIEDKINNKEVKEISQYAFIDCLITNVTIYAKIRCINRRAFYGCTKLTYINIPSTVRYIGLDVFCLFERRKYYKSNFFGEQVVAFVIYTVDLAVTFEFVSGRTENLYIGSRNFAGRKKAYIIYPSKFIPLTSDTSDAFQDAKTSFVCAPSTFTFYTKTTTTNSSKCPSPLFKGIPANSACKYKLIRMHKQFIIANLLICLFNPIS